MQTRGSDRGLPPLFFWSIWLIGPASYGSAFAFCLAAPELCNDPPNLLLGCVLVLTHLLAGAMTVGLVVFPGPHRLTAEFWVLLIYWAGIAGWIFPGLYVAASSNHIDPTFSRICTIVSALAVILIPVLGIGRVVLARRKRP